MLPVTLPCVSQPSSTIGSATSLDGRRLLTRHWPAASAAARPRASILLVHGLGEHSGRYEHVGAFLAGPGFDTHALDLRGFGGSDGRRGHVRQWSELHDDIESRMRAIRTSASDAGDPSRPVILFGHSLGALLVLGAVLDGRTRPDLMILEGLPLISSEGRALRTAAALAVRVVPELRVRSPDHPDWLSRDPSVGAAFMADPLVVHSTTVRFAALAFEAQRLARERLPRLEQLAIPVLALHGTDDRRVPPAGSEPLAGMPNVTRRLYPGLRHELHNEPEWKAVLGDVVTWLDARLDRESERAPAATTGVGRPAV
jgi:alpha-beta hydrolase superfamily lysophospholipase